MRLNEQPILVGTVASLALPRKWFYFQFTVRVGVEIEIVGGGLLIPEPRVSAGGSCSPVSPPVWRIIIVNNFRFTPRHWWSNLFVRVE